MEDRRKKFSESLANIIEERGWRGLFERDNFTVHIPYNPVGHIAEHDKDDIAESKAILVVEGEYSASNRLNLLVEGLDKGYGDDRWMTRGQAESLGYTIDPKTEGVELEHWKFTERRPAIDNETHEPALDDEGKPVFKDYSLIHPELSTFTVFNGQDIIGLKSEKFPEGPDGTEVYMDLITSLGFEITKDANNTYVQKDGKGARYQLGGASYPVGEAIVEKLGIRDDNNLCACLIGGLLESAISSYDKHTCYEPDSRPQADLMRKDHNAIYRAARDADKAVAWALNPELRQKIEREFELRKAGTLHSMNIHSNAFEHFGTDYPIDPNVVEIKDRHYVHVPYEERDELKAVAENAQYCFHGSAWWVPKDSDLSKVAKWESAVSPSEDLSKSPVVQEFVAACKKQGLILGEDDVVMDGEFHKVSVEGSDLINTGAYRASLRADMPPFGSIVNSETGVKEEWAYSGRSVHPNDIAALSVEADKRKDEHHQKFNAFTELVATESKSFYVKDLDESRSGSLRYNHFKAADQENCPYLAKENLTLPTAEIKVDDYGLPNVPHCGSDGELVLDVRNSHGKVESLVRIDTEKQSFQRDYLPEGAYHLVAGDKEQDGRPDVIVKDFAQAVRIHNASGLSVAVAFDDDNLAPVFSSVFQRHGGDIPLVVAVDKAGDLEQVINDVHLYRTEFVAGNVVVENMPDLNAMFKDKGAEAVVDSVKVISDHIVKTAEKIEAFKAYRQSKELPKSQSQETGLGA